MASSTTRWNLVVPSDLDRSLRQFLAAGGRGKKGDLSLFVSEAVSKYIFEMAHQAALDKNADADPGELEAMIDESLAWARAQRRDRKARDAVSPNQSIQVDAAPRSGDLAQN